MDSIIRMDYNMIKRCTENESVLKATALALSVKAHNQNSLICNFSINKLMHIIHCNFATAKQALDAAIKMGLVEIRTYTKKNGKSHSDLFVPKFKSESKKCAVFNVSRNNGVRIYLKSENDKYNNKNKNTLKKQTFSEICDLILEIFISSKVDSFYAARNNTHVGEHRQAGDIIRQFNKLKEKDIKSHCHINQLYKKCRSFDEDEITMDNQGLSCRTISEWITGKFVSTYQVRRLMQKMRKSGLVKIRKCASIFLNNDPDYAPNEKDPDRFLKWLTGKMKVWDRDENEIPARNRTFLGRKGRHDVLKPMARLYIPTHCIFGTNKHLQKS